MSEQPKKPAKKKVELDPRFVNYKHVWVVVESERGEVHPVLRGRDDARLVLAVVGIGPVDARRHGLLRPACRVGERQRARRRAADRGWFYAAHGRGEHVVLTSGATLSVDAIYARAFDLPADAT